MDSSKSARSDKRRLFLSAIGIVAAVMVLAPPIVQAASQKVNVVKSVKVGIKGTASVKELVDATSEGQDSAALGGAGEVIPKTVNTNMVAGGEGFWGTGVCGAPGGDTDPDTDTSSDPQVTVPAATPGDPDNIISGVLLGSPDAAIITVKAPELPSGNNPVLIFRTSAELPSQTIMLPGGLRASPSRIVLDCVAGGTYPSNPATFVVMGH